MRFPRHLIHCPTTFPSINIVPPFPYIAPVLFSVCKDRNYIFCVRRHSFQLSMKRKGWTFLTACNQRWYFVVKETPGQLFEKPSINVRTVVSIFLQSRLGTWSRASFVSIQFKLFNNPNPNNLLIKIIIFFLCLFNYY